MSLFRRTAACMAAATCFAGIGISAATAAPAPRAPAPAASQSPEATTKGLIASDWLTVEKETGEWNGDEPVMVTFRIEAVTGIKDSTRASLVNSSPGEIASGVDAGDKVHIRDEHGDVWLQNIQPLGVAEVSSAIKSKSELHVPVAMTVTVMMEGDFSPAGNVADLGSILGEHVVKAVAPTIENLHIKPTSLDPSKETELVKAVKDAEAQVTEKLTPNTDTIITLILQRIYDWEHSLGDPDDLVGLSATALVPVAEDLAPLIELGGGAKAMNLDANYTKATTKAVHIPVLYKGDVEIRGGLLMPPSTFDGKEQSWTTTYQGSYLENRWAVYKVDTHAWPVVNW